MLISKALNLLGSKFLPPPRPLPPPPFLGFLPELRNWLPPLFQAYSLQQVLSAIALVRVGLISDRRLSDPGALGL